MSRSRWGLERWDGKAEGEGLKQHYGASFLVEERLSGWRLTRGISAGRENSGTTPALHARDGRWVLQRCGELLFLPSALLRKSRGNEEGGGKRRVTA